MRKKDKPNPGDLIVVEWIDAHSTDSSWLNEESPEFKKALKPTDCQTVGWVIRVEKTHVVVAGCRSVQIADNSWDYGSIWNIPTGMIKSIGVLKTHLGVTPKDNAGGSQ